MIMLRYSSVGNYVQVIVWVFCCLPILLDYCVGMPEYKTVYWYVPFIVPMSNDYVSCIYDIVVLATSLMLDAYCRYSAGKNLFREKRWGSIVGDRTLLLAIAILLPFAYVIAAGLAPYYLTYGDPQTRGMPSGSSMMVTWLQLISCIAFGQWFFRKKRIVFSDWLVLGMYVLSSAWLSGKRFMIALLAVVLIFFYLRRDLSSIQRRVLKTLLPLAGIGLLGFSAFYLIGVRPLSDTDPSSVYEMLRVDFGRDDVTKYSIYQELFLGNHILEYPGQSFASTFLIFVPRAIWPEKPFMHFQYLTSSILDLPISQLPAGTTPSWIDMCVCNMGVLGLAVSAIGLLVCVYVADRAGSTSCKAIFLVLIIALMTQSIDAYLSLVFLLPLAIVLGRDSGIAVVHANTFVVTQTGRYKKVKRAES